ncbi:hypothetical protein NC99_22400 [Sunxiuqinia dokdonensis]|uniref:Uncharacterized protein n=1 Tax=Sunxiuqinia dokdonensis TaxID=1409788 RepID=A0A0L8V995_9BACT|nr:hypothetical protein NC99_22400 [Sunxiuqinia dokdonensis]
MPRKTFDFGYLIFNFRYISERSRTETDYQPLKVIILKMDKNFHQKKCEHLNGCPAEILME